MTTASTFSRQNDVGSRARARAPISIQKQVSNRLLENLVLVVVLVVESEALHYLSNQAPRFFLENKAHNFVVCFSRSGAVCGRFFRKIWYFYIYYLLGLYVSTHY